jgi:GT2 family glycosyltransferase
MAALMSASPVLSVIIITWNDADRLERCLRSIQRCKEEIDHEVIVVDDGSTDRTRAMLETFPSVKVVENKRNLGMAPARNAGIKHAGGDYLLFLDSDTEVRPGCFANAVKALAADPEIWVGGCKTFRPDGSLEYNAKSFYTLRALILRRTVLGKWFPNAACLRNHLNRHKDHSKNFVTEWAAGAALIVKRDAIEKLGYFDERFTYYFDDYDLCYRAWKMDRKVIYIADSMVVHHLSMRSRKSLRSALRHLRSAIYFYLKTRRLYPSSKRNIDALRAKEI